MRLRELRRPEVIGIFQELSFKSLIDRIPKIAAAAAAEERPTPRQACSTG